MIKEFVSDEKELIVRLKNGDMLAFDEIYKRYNKLLYGFAIRIVKFNQDAEDIVHDVFIKIWQNKETLKTDTSFRSFLFTIAYRATINIIRKKAVKEEYVEALKYLQTEIGVDDVYIQIEYNELNETLKQALTELPARQREIYILNREKGLTYSEIANKLNISVNTVENHMVKALKFLRTKLKASSIISLLFLYLFV